MTRKYIDVRLFVTEEIEDWGDGDVTATYRLENKFELLDTDIPEKYRYGIGESWAQSDHYYEVVQNLVAIFDE